MSNIITLSHHPLNSNHSEQPIYEGVTTVWLLSTLGNPSTLFKSSDNSTGSSAIRKKDIINVSIPQTCKVIENNELELSLRYVSNLLYGVTVCYHRKTEYVLSDLTGLLAQLQKKLYNSSSSSTKKNNSKINRNVGATTIFDFSTNGCNNGTSKTNGFLNDDPLFDINQMKNFESFISFVPSENASEALTIKRQDYMKELTNSNNFDNPTNSDSSQFRNFSIRQMNHSMTLDDIPIDVDFDLDIDDIVSQQGTTYHSTTDSQRTGSDLEIKYNDQQFVLEFDGNESEVNNYENNSASKKPEDNTGINLGIVDDNQSEDEEASLEDENDNGPALKKMKLTNKSTIGNTLFSLVILDERTGLSTDTLRRNHSNYCEIMESKNKSNKRIVNDVGNNWQQIIDLNEQADILRNCWMYIFTDREDMLNIPFNKNAPFSDANSIERGRKRSRYLVSNPNSERSSSNVSSEEQGRRMAMTKENSFNNNDDLLLNLEQIDEELDENDSRATSSNHQQDFLHLNLDLPPSSFGRANTRNNTRNDNNSNSAITSSGSNERDVVDVLYSKTMSGRKKNSKETTSTIASGDSSMIGFDQRQSQKEYQPPTTLVLDYQTRKFYDYIKERCFFVGKTSRSYPPFERKLLFEDIVPSELSTAKMRTTDDNNETGHITIIDRKIAASAFLSLLNLASKDMIGIREYHGPGNTNNWFQMMNGDDIVVYA